MSDLPLKMSQEFLETMTARARYVGKKCGTLVPGCPEPRKVDREDLKIAENYARGMLTFSRNGVAAKLAQDVLLLVHNLDSLAAEIYPVFEMIDRVMFQENGTLVVKDGWKLYDGAGYLLSEGATLREFLTDHITRYGENVTIRYDHKLDHNFKLEKQEPGV